MLPLAVAVMATAIDCGTHKLEQKQSAYFDCSYNFGSNEGYWWRVTERYFDVDTPGAFCFGIDVEVDGKQFHFSDGMNKLNHHGGRTTTGGGVQIENLNTVCDAVITVTAVYEKLYPIETPAPWTPRPWTPAPRTPAPWTPAPWTPTPWTPRPWTPTPPACHDEGGEVEVTGCGTTLHFPVGRPFKVCDPCSGTSLGMATVTRQGDADYVISIPPLGASLTVECGQSFSLDRFSGQIRCGSSGPSTGMIAGIVAGAVVAVAAAGAVGFVLYRRRTRAPQTQHYVGVKEPMAAYSPLESSQPPAAVPIAE